MGGGQHTSPSLISREPASRGGNGHVNAETNAAALLGRSKPPRSDIQGAASVIIHGAQKYPRGHPSGSIGTPTHPHVRLGTHGQLPYLPPPLNNLVGHDRSMPACYGTMHWPVVQSRQYGYSVCGIESTPSVIMAQLQTFNADQFSAG